MGMETQGNNLFEKRRLRGRLMLVGLVVIFALPAIIAKTVLDQHWYTAGVTNSGDLVEPRVTLEEFGIALNTEEPGWVIAYIAPSVCDGLCQQQLHYVNQSYLALGKNKERVTPLILQNKSTTPNEAKALTDNLEASELEHSELQTHLGSKALESTFGTASIVVIDPLGQLVMVYSSVEQPQELIAQSKGLIHDLRKLLKLSRVG